MLDLVPYFLAGVAIGALLSIIWGIHLAGKIAIITLLLVGVCALLLYPASFYSSFMPWEYELAQFLGIICGSKIGDWMVEDILNS